MTILDSIVPRSSQYQSLMESEISR